MQDHGEVAQRLEEVAGLLRFAGAPWFKVQAYEHAAQVVLTVADELGSIIEQARLRELEGIGAGLAQQIDELWNTGSSQLLERLRGESPAGAAELMQVAGMSPKRIVALGAALGIGSVGELRQACLEQRVRGVKGFGDKTEQRLLEGCERWAEARQRDDTSEPLLLAQARELQRAFTAKLALHFERLAFVGALRRGAETLTELELLVSGTPEHAFEQLRRLRQVLRVDEARAVAWLSRALPLRVHTCEVAGFGAALLRTTADAAHLQLLRARASERGLSLDALAGAEESEVYAALGLPFVPPELQSGVRGVELAAQGRLQGLLEVGHVRGLVHCHTTYSDGRHSVLAMAQAAHELGMQYITITDHSPSAHYARGVGVDRLKQQWDEIAEAEEQVPIRILRGTESDILRDGSLDYPDEILEQFDVVIASIHARHRMTSREMTERLKRALSLPLFKIWGHGLGRILNHRAPIDCDVPSVLEALARGGGAIELNADPHRLDLPSEWIPAARELGIPFVISVDAHSTAGFGVLEYGVTQARRGGLTVAEVLNTHPPEVFTGLVRPRAKAL